MKNFSTFIMIIFSALILTQCKKEKKVETNSSETAKQKKELKMQVFNFDNPPEFRKDGILYFIKNKNDVIFEIEFEVASTMEEHARGLMYRPSMKENRGMLFLFQEERIQSFYMRNTIIPLDILYVNAKREIIDIYKNTKPYDETSLPSCDPAMFVVEVNAGICDKYGIEKGCKINF